MLVNNTRTSVVAVTVALITGVMVALWLALLSAPAQAIQPGGGLGTSSQCSDKKDNDADTLIDFGKDPGCTSLSDNTESPNPSMTPSNAKKDRVAFKRVQVMANRKFIHTGVTLQDGDELRITATGKMKPSFTGGEYDCNGWADHPARSDWPLPGEPEYGLIGALQGSRSSGNHHFYFWVGCRLPASPNKTWVHQGGTQQLWLGINDDNVGDNAGYFQATIEVFRERQPDPTPQPQQCSDSKDNDNDGKIDFGTGTSNDPGCESATDDTENPDPPNTAPTIDPIKPAPSSKIRDRSPLIEAKVSDAETTNLAQSNIKLFVDGKPIMGFSYDATTGQLSYQSGRLDRGSHAIQVEATDEQGQKETKVWNFKVVKKVVRR
jgi:hypothetical protein